MRVENYYQPSDLKEALACMNAHACVKALAGGTDLVIALQEKTIKPDAIVDLSHVKEMKGVSMQADGLHIGAMNTFTQLESNELIKTHLPMLACAASQVGSPQVRNSGTVGGNLANAATAADSVPVLMAADAVAVIASAEGTRTIPVTEIPTGLNKTCLAPNELIVEFIVKPLDGKFCAFEKVGRRKALAISRINMGMVLELDGKTVKTAAVAFGAVGKTAYRAKVVEDFLVGKELTDAAIDEAAAVAEQMVVEVLAGRSTTPYKKKIAAAVIRRALIKAQEG